MDSFLLVDHLKGITLLVKESAGKKNTVAEFHDREVANTVVQLLNFRGKPTPEKSLKNFARFTNRNAERKGTKYDIRSPSLTERGKELALEIQVELDTLFELYPDCLTARQLSKYYDEEIEIVRVAIRELEKENLIEYVHTGGDNQKIIFPVGQSPEYQLPSKKQSDALCIIYNNSDKSGIVQMSRKEILEQSGHTNWGGLDSAIFALKQKGYIKILDKGDFSRATTYQITEAAKTYFLSHAE